MKLMYKNLNNSYFFASYIQYFIYIYVIKNTYYYYIKYNFINITDLVIFINIKKKLQILYNF